MPLDLLCATAIVAFVVAWMLTWQLRQVFLKTGLLDVPNSRSSHVVPVPRGGGLAIVIVVLVGIGVLATLEDALPTAFSSALMLAGSMVALVGFLDDRRHVPAPVRLAVHFVAVGVALAVVAAGTTVVLAGMPLDLGAGVFVGVVVACVWFLNLFNFMDGIDGIAAAEAVFVSLAAAVMVALGDGPTHLVALWVAVGAATLGFLLLNWSPASIFMGDVGSGFLGFMIAVNLVYSAGVSDMSVWTAVILTAPFVADATVTLCMRVVRGEQWHAAHRSHAYQHLSRRWRSHAKVTLLYMSMNVLVVAPIAWISLRNPGLAPMLACVLVVSLGLAAYLAGAGRVPVEGRL